MTWTLKLRGDQTGTITHEYLCPDHGRFTADVPRADVPDEMFCRVEVEQYDGVFRSLVNYCGRSSPWSPGGISTRVKAGEVIRGKVETSGLPADVCMSTEALADGMPMSEFKARRAKLHADLAIKKMRALTGRTGKVMR